MRDTALDLHAEARLRLDQLRREADQALTIRDSTKVPFLRQLAAETLLMKCAQIRDVWCVIEEFEL